MLVKPTLFAAAKDAGLKLSLAEWSLHRALKAGKLDHLDFPAKAKNDFGIDAVEYVNGFSVARKWILKKQEKTNLI